MKTLWLWLERLTSLVVVLASALILWNATLQPGPTAKTVTNEQIVPLDGIVMDLGRHSESVSAGDATLVEFADFECRFCRQHAREVLPRIRREFLNDGTLRYVFRHLPIVGLHGNALVAAKASDCAADQNKFWQLHERLFKADSFDRGQIVSYSEELGLDQGKFETCLDGRDSETMSQDLAAAGALLVRATPTFFVGRVADDGKTLKLETRINGVLPFERFRAQLHKVIDSKGNKLSLEH